MDEIFEVLTLIQTGKIPPRPVVCMGQEYWKHLGTFIREGMLAEGTISPEDMEIYFVTDNPEEAVQYIRNYQGTSLTQIQESQDQG